MYEFHVDVDVQLLRHVHVVLVVHFQDNLLSMIFLNLLNVMELLEYNVLVVVVCVLYSHHIQMNDFESHFEEEKHRA